MPKTCLGERPRCLSCGKIGSTRALALIVVGRRPSGRAWASIRHEHRLSHGGASGRRRAGAARQGAGRRAGGQVGEQAGGRDGGSGRWAQDRAGGLGGRGEEKPEKADMDSNHSGNPISLQHSRWVKKRGGNPFPSSSPPAPPLSPASSSLRLTPAWPSPYSSSPASGGTN